MERKPKRQRHYTFMVVPHDARGKTYSLRIPAFIVYSTIGLAIFSIFMVGSSLVYSSLLSRRLVHYYKAVAMNREQQQVIHSFANETKRVDEAIAALIEEDAQLRKILGLKDWKNKIKLSGASNEYAGPEAKISSEFKKADLKLTDRKESFEELKQWVSEVRRRYASTPSRWPVYGRIVSRFGYRVYPWRGFHTGLDLNGRYGAPIYVTGDGVVKFVGWRRGYGRTVIVDHGYGTETLYAHTSKYVVEAGQKVRKGQLIAYVGNTGYTTGPHLHYEVRKANKPVNPIAYLNLNITTASKIWRR